MEPRPTGYGIHFSASCGTPYFGDPKTTIESHTCKMQKQSTFNYNARDVYIVVKFISVRKYFIKATVIADNIFAIF